MNIEKWNTILKLKKLTYTNADIYMDNYWLCTDFGFSNNYDFIFIMKPLMTHPYGIKFGLIPYPNACYTFTEQEMEKFFNIEESKEYKHM